MFSLNKKSCTQCQYIITSWSYKYHGKNYCRKCYDHHFIKKACVRCHRLKLIKKGDRFGLCKKCWPKDKPCIRCDKTNFSIGLVTATGPVCKSCAKYFREPKQCSACKTFKLNVSNRRLKNGASLKLCHNCYQKKEQIVCSKCFHRRHEFFYNLNKKAICKNCLTLPVRHCKNCNSIIPSGLGSLCKECCYIRMLEQRMLYLTPLLNSEFQQFFAEFKIWLIKRRGVGFTAIKISHYFRFFHEINQLAETLNNFPSYRDMVKHFTVAKTRQYLLVMHFLSDSKVIEIDSKIKSDFSNQDMIERYLNYFDSNSLFHQLILGYFEKLQTKLINNKTSIRSIRLALTPAVKYLQLCIDYGFAKPSQEVLEGFIWSSPGQRAAITGFINFLSDKSLDEISLRKIPKSTAFQRPNLGKNILKQRFIDALRMKQDNAELLKASIAYLHGIDIPKFVKLTKQSAIRDKTGKYYLRLGNKKLYLPLYLARKLRNRCI